MSFNQIERPEFFEGQYLGAGDLDAAVDYGRLQRARHLLGAHTWGIAAGLQLTEAPPVDGGGAVDVFVQPGYAWDGFGRPLVLLAPYKLPAELFKQVVFDGALDGGDPPGRLFEVWVLHDESPAGRARSPEEDCGDDHAFTRVRETLRVVVGERQSHADRHDPISVASYAVDAQDVLQVLDPQDPAVVLFDESVPYQVYPDDDERSQWLVPIGAVRWQPNPVGGLPGLFVKRNDDDQLYSRRLRRHIGVVAEGVHAADGLLRLRDRSRNPAAKVWSPELVWVEGDLRIDGTLSLCDADSGALRWRVAGENTGLSVSEAIGTGPEGRFFIKAGGNVGIGSDNPKAKLTVFDDQVGARGIEFLGGGVNSHIPYSNGEIYLTGDLRSGVTGTGDFQFRTYDGNQYATRLMVKGNTGRVGIGTTSPSTRLQVAGGKDANLSDDDAGFLLVGSPSGQNVIVDDNEIMARNNGIRSDLHLQAEGGDLVVHSWQNEEQKFVVKHSGRVGVGTSSPTAALDVRGTVKAAEIRTTLITADGSGNVSLSNSNTWSDFPELAATFNLTVATHALVLYQVTMAGGGSHLVTRLVIDGTDQPASRAIDGNTEYWSPSGFWMGPLISGSHTIKVQYRTPEGGSNNPGGTDWHSRVLRVLVFGAG